MMPYTDAPLELFHDERPDEALPLRYSSTPHYFTLRKAEDLAGVLGRSGIFFIEARNYQALGRHLAVLQEGMPDFGLCLSTAHCTDASVAQMLTATLNDRFGMSRAKHMQIVTCLQEAISNAVIHGNLQVDYVRDSLEAFERCHAQIDHLMHDSHLRELRVYVRAWDYGGSFRLCITHEGAGRLLPAMLAESHPEAKKRLGRGLFIIQSLAEEVSTDAWQTSIHITFAY